MDFYLSEKSMKEDTQKYIDALRTKTPSQETKIRALSGGNQQKVILGRWLLTDPEVLLLDEPTRGIDVGAKYEIYQLIIDLANRGKVVIVVSSEMPELLGICDRIMVMSGGRLAGEIDAEEATQELIMTYAAKVCVIFKQKEGGFPDESICKYKITLCRIQSTGFRRQGKSVERRTYQ